MKKISKGTKDTKKIAQSFLKNILRKKHLNAHVVALSGELGAGKTTFTQHLAKEFGVKRKIISPTFVLIRRYQLNKGKYKQLYHLDAYRLKSGEDLLKLGWKEIISNPEHLVLIEWPENVKKVMPKKHTRIKIVHQKNGEPSHRLFEIKNSF